MTPQFKLTLLIIIALSVFGFAATTKAGEIYAEFGVYHYLESDQLIEDNDNFGGDTYSTIELGVAFYVEPAWYNVGISQYSVALHHLSHPDRGYPFNDHEEAWLNGVGVKFRWSGYKF